MNVSMRRFRNAAVETFARWVGQTCTGNKGFAVKQPSILDVVHGVKRVLPAHPEVSAWWYTPPQRLRLAGDLPGSGAAPLCIEVVVEAAGAEEVPCATIARELTAALSATPHIEVRVRIHRGDREERPLFRIVSPGKRSSSSEAPRPA
jgi:hypothetical protein